MRFSAGYHRRLAQLGAKQARRWRSQAFDPKAVVVPSVETFGSTEGEKHGQEIDLLTQPVARSHKELGSAESWLMRQ
jgi:hypothetical protein